MPVMMNWNRIEVTSAPLVYSISAGSAAAVEMPSPPKIRMMSPAKMKSSFR